jgi:hypothetical protein
MVLSFVHGFTGTAELGSFHRLLVRSYCTL